MLKYDEMALGARLSVLSRNQKTAFAAACAQRLFPLLERYAPSRGSDLEKLATVIRNTWRALEGEDIDLSSDGAIVESLIPSEDGEWLDSMAYEQNGAAAAAFAVRTWLTNDPQEALWAARQIYEGADYAAQRALPGLDLNMAGAEQRLLETDVVQEALSGIEEDLNEVESGREAYAELRSRAEAAGTIWARLVP